MTADELTAFIPVDRAVALKRNPKGSWKMPAVPLYRRLLEKCNGRVVRSDIGWAANAVDAANKEVEKAFVDIASDGRVEDVDGRAEGGEARDGRKALHRLRAGIADDGRSLPQRSSEAHEIRVSWNGDRAERRQMLTAPLHVQQNHPARPHEIHQRHQRNLRCVALYVKHRFAGEIPVNPQAVQATRRAHSSDRTPRRCAPSPVRAAACSLR